MVSIDRGGERLTESLVRDRSKIRKVWAAVARRWPGGGVGSSLVALGWRWMSEEVWVDAAVAALRERRRDEVTTAVLARENRGVRCGDGGGGDGREEVMVMKVEGSR